MVIYIYMYGWWFGTCWIFPFNWECHHPQWHIFFRVGLKPPTSNQLWLAAVSSNAKINDRSAQLAILEGNPMVWGRLNSRTPHKHIIDKLTTLCTLPLNLRWLLIWWCSLCFESSMFHVLALQTLRFWICIPLYPCVSRVLRFTGFFKNWAQFFSGSCETRCSWFWVRLALPVCLLELYTRDCAEMCALSQDLTHHGWNLGHSCLRFLGSIAAQNSYQK